MNADTDTDTDASTLGAKLLLAELESVLQRIERPIVESITVRVSSRAPSTCVAVIRLPFIYRKVTLTVGEMYK